MSDATASPPPVYGESMGELGRAIAPSIIVLIVVQMVFASATGGFDVATLGGPDSYMHLTRVQALEDGASWFDPREPRIGTDGHVQHWTRLFDLLLWGAARVLAPFLGFDAALLLAGQLVSPVILAAAILTINWASRPLMGPTARFLACLLLIIQPAVLAYAGLGRADHHSLLLLLFLGLFGLIVRIVDPTAGSTRHPARLGAIAIALAIWVSSESLVFVGTFLLTTGLLWVAGARRLAIANRDLALGAASLLFLALIVERGGHDPLSAEADRLSIIHVVLFGLIATFWSAVPYLQPELIASRARRFTVGLAGATVVGSAMILLFPGLSDGILGEVDLLYRELRLEKIHEIQPPVRLAWLVSGEFGVFLNRLLFWVGLACLALPFLAVQLLRRERILRVRWLPVAAAIAFTLPLTFYQWRWAIYSQSLLVMPYAAAVGQLVTRLSIHMAGWRLSVARSAMVVAGLFCIPALTFALPSPPPIEFAAGACPIAAIARTLNGLDARPRTIMAMADLGPELLYRTHHRVLSIANHRPQPGFAATVRVLAAERPSEARAIFDGMGADWLLLCGSRAEAALVRDGARGNGQRLYHRLLADEEPDWLRRLTPPGIAGTSVRLYERVPNK